MCKNKFVKSGVENVRTNLDTKIYDTLIPRNIRLAEAPSHGLPINMYDTKSAGAESYRMLDKRSYGKEECIKVWQQKNVVWDRELIH